MCDRGYERGSLQTLADSFRVKRKGNKHLAGSDPLITSETYLQLLEILKPEFFLI